MTTISDVGANKETTKHIGIMSYATTANSDNEKAYNEAVIQNVADFIIQIEDVSVILRNQSIPL